jgi:hypothetical protein
MPPRLLLLLLGVKLPNPGKEQPTQNQRSRGLPEHRIQFKVQPPLDWLPLMETSLGLACHPL